MPNSENRPLPTDTSSKPAGFYFLMVFLAVGVSFIGWNFGGTKGALIGFFFTCVINIYALSIKND